MAAALQEPVTVLLKEHLPGARSVACNEMQALVHLAGGLPDRKWHAAVAPVSGELPIVPLLGEPLNCCVKACQPVSIRAAIRVWLWTCPIL